MTLKVGVIADDFTGATDIASFLVLNGLSTVQLCQLDENAKAPDVEAIVISHKSRSCDPKEAVAMSLRSYEWLKANNCERIYFKYCSTFDSSAKGNIGPVTDALMQQMGVDFTIFQPALPVNGRTVYKGYLFVGDVLLEESGMKNHPITPMTDSSLVRLVQMQSQGKCAVIDNTVLDKGVKAVQDKVASLKAQGYKYAVVDALTEEHLVTQGLAFADMKLVTGGSGLAIGLARALKEADANSAKAQEQGRPSKDKTVVFSGSCSVMTNLQVQTYQAKAPAMQVSVDKLLDDSVDQQAYLQSFVDFVMANQNTLAPLVYATSDSTSLKEIQEKYGVQKSSAIVENFFASLAKALQACGIKRFIVAGGETSGIVTQALGVKGFYIGPAIAPGVPWVRSVDNDICLTLKSGNFGDEDFFAKAQGEF